MTFFAISLKMLQKNFYRYRLHFLCSFFAITLFFCFATLFTNDSFMTGHDVNFMIASNIIFPSILAAAFLLVFAPYSYSVFLSARKQEYGILSSLGMSPMESWKWLLAESIVLGAIALGAAFLAGTLLSLFFYGVISHVIGITALKWAFPYKAYLATALLYGLVLAITAALQGIQLLGRRIRPLLLAPYRAEAKGRGYQWMEKIFPDYMGRHLLEFSLLARHKRDWAARSAFSSLLIGCALYLAGFCTVFSASVLQDLEHYCPYDLAYSEFLGQNRISGNALRNALSQHQVSITAEKQLPYLRDPAFNYLPVSGANQILGCDYQVPEGSFLNLFQYELQDGYGHDLTEVSHISLRTGKELHSCGSDIKILFNQNPTLAERTLILNDADFNQMLSSGYYWEGRMHLFHLQYWEDASEGIEALQSLLLEANGLTPEEQWQFYRATSKTEDFQIARQSSQFAYFLMGFVEILLLMAACLLIHFRIAAEREENRRAMQSLFMVGATASERLHLCLFKNRMRFLPPFAAASLAALPFSYKTGEMVYHSGNIWCMAVGLLGLASIFAMAKFTGYYSKREFESYETNA